MATTTETDRATSPLTPFVSVFFDPLEAVPSLVTRGRFATALLLTMALSAAGAAAVAVRVDAARTVLPGLELAKASEREISEQVAQAQRVAIVGGVAGGLFGVPVIALLAASALSLFSWLLGGRGRFVERFAAVTVAMVPFAMAKGVLLVSALRQDAIAPSAVAGLVPSSLLAVLNETSLKAAGPSFLKAESWLALVSLVDFFHLWSAGLLGLGFAAATRLPARVAVPVGAALYFLTMAALKIGLPGLAPPGAPS